MSGELIIVVQAYDIEAECGGDDELELQMSMVVIAFTPHVGPTYSEFLELFGEYLLFVVCGWRGRLVGLGKGIGQPFDVRVFELLVVHSTHFDSDGVGLRVKRVDDEVLVFDSICEVFSGFFGGYAGEGVSVPVSFAFSVSDFAVDMLSLSIHRARRMLFVSWVMR